MLSQSAVSSLDDFLSSRDLLRQEFGLLTAKGVAYTLPEFLRGQEPSRFNSRSLAMNPLWLDPIEPWTLERQPARDDAYPLFAGVSALQYGLIVLTQPGSYLLAHVPGRVIPNEHQRLFALHLNS